MNTESRPTTTLHIPRVDVLAIGSAVARLVKTEVKPQFVTDQGVPSCSVYFQTQDDSESFAPPIYVARTPDGDLQVSADPSVLPIDRVNDITVMRELEKIKSPIS